MLKVVIARLKQGHRTMKYPAGAPPALPGRFRGRPLVDPSKCAEGCSACTAGCPTGALFFETDPEGGRELSLDLGKCLFCTDCAELCPHGAIAHSSDYRLSANKREDLLLRGDQELRLAGELGKRLKKLYGRSLKLRQVSAGGCNACEADVNVLGTVAWDLGRFGVQMVASPRHADGILVTGPVTANMELALKKTYASVPDPKVVIAVGSCAISGGPYLGHREVGGGAIGTVPVDLFIPGCPPHPLTILDGLLRLIGKVKEGR